MLVALFDNAPTKATKKTSVANLKCLTCFKRYSTITEKPDFFANYLHFDSVRDCRMQHRVVIKNQLSAPNPMIAAWG